jgi:hypothetical protein
MTTEQVSIRTGPPRATEPDAKPGESGEGSRRGLYIGIAVGAVVVIALLVVGVIYMAGHPAQTETLRDIFIIFMALEGLLIGVALVVLVVQLALLTNLLKHEIRPILDSTNEAARTLRGTAEFMSQNVVDPVIKVHASVAAVKSALDLLRPNRRS